MGLKTPCDKEEQADPAGDDEDDAGTPRQPRHVLHAGLDDCRTGQGQDPRDEDVPGHTPPNRTKAAGHPGPKNRAGDGVGRRHRVPIVLRRPQNAGTRGLRPKPLQLGSAW